MSTPYIAQTIHSFGVLSALGAVIVGGNIASVTQPGAGRYIVNLGSEIDPNERVVVFTPTSSAVIPVHVLANDTVSSFEVDVRNLAGAQVDNAFNFILFRCAIAA